MDPTPVASGADSALQIADSAVAIPAKSRSVFELHLQLDFHAERVVAERAVEHRLEFGLGFWSLLLLAFLLLCHLP